MILPKQQRLRQPDNNRAHTPVTSNPAGPCPLITVWLTHSSGSFQDAFARQTALMPGLRCAWVGSTPNELMLALAGASAPDVIVLEADWTHPHTDRVFECIRLKSPRTKVIVVANTVDILNVSRAFYAGASGYLLKDALGCSLAEAIRDVYAGGACLSPSVVKLVVDMIRSRSAPVQEYSLTGRERTHLQLITRGLSKKQIANQLSLSFHTVDSHLRNIYRKLHVNTRSAAVAKALQERLC
jgi:DNA-binding NarL/FixJ family response regulator